MFLKGSAYNKPFCHIRCFKVLLKLNNNTITVRVHIHVFTVLHKAFDSFFRIFVKRVLQ